MVSKYNITVSLTTNLFMKNFQWSIQRKENNKFYFYVLTPNNFVRIVKWATKLSLKKMEDSKFQIDQIWTKQDQVGKIKIAEL
jgi:hypothetical protein